MEGAVVAQFTTTTPPNLQPEKPPIWILSNPRCKKNIFWHYLEQGQKGNNNQDIPPMFCLFGLCQQRNHLPSRVTCAISPNCNSHVHEKCLLCDHVHPCARPASQSKYCPSSSSYTAWNVTETQLQSNRTKMIDLFEQMCGKDRKLYQLLTSPERYLWEESKSVQYSIYIETQDSSSRKTVLIGRLVIEWLFFHPCRRINPIPTSTWKKVTALWFWGFWGSSAPHWVGKYIIPGGLAPPTW